MTFYTTREDAIYREITEVLNGAGLGTADDYDTDKIADQVLDYEEGQGFYCTADETTFWAIVQEAAL